MPEEPFPRMTQKRINRDEILMRYHADTAGVFTFLQQIFVLEWYACQNILRSLLIFSNILYWREIAMCWHKFYMI